MSITIVISLVSIAISVANIVSCAVFLYRWYK